jgi:hypothetical protein
MKRSQKENAEAARREPSSFWLLCLITPVSPNLFVRYRMVTESSLMTIAVAPSEPMEPN